MLEKIKNIAKNINIAVVLDHSGRGGNAFFLTIFDQHTEVLSCPLMHYTYSTFFTEFKDQIEIESQAAMRFSSTKSYFRLLYNDPVGEHRKLSYRMGLDPENAIDRDKIRQLFDDFINSKESFTRRELVVIPFLIYAQATGRDITKFKYILLSDAISLRHEDVKKSFSGKVVDMMLSDFPEAKLFHIVRDPRATFASPRHQFTNSLGNMYALQIGNFCSRIKTLIIGKLEPENSCVYLYWLLYLMQSYKTICAKKNQFPNHFYTVKNEDLNIYFVPTVKKLVDWLGVCFADQWRSDDYSPTIVGYPWKGTGAYNSRYQQNMYGLLKNDSKEVSESIAKPNSYVVERWRKKLNKREIQLIERLFHTEFVEQNYSFVSSDCGSSDLVFMLKSTLLPFEGELPTIHWILKGFKVSIKEFFSRLNYGILFPFFYILSRVILFDLVLRKKAFKI